MSKGEGSWLPGMKHAVDCRCERCKEAGVNGWYKVRPAKPPMTRERLSEEERASLLNGLASYLTQGDYRIVEERVEAMISARVTAACLAAEAAENEACAKLVHSCEERRKKLLGWDRTAFTVEQVTQLILGVEKNIRSLLTAPQVSALERVKAEARLSEAKKWCYDAGKMIGPQPHSDDCGCVYCAYVRDLEKQLSAPVVPGAS